MLRVFRRHPYLCAALALASLAALWLAVDLVTDLVWWSAHANEPARPWMTVGYVGRSWGLDPREIDAIAGLPLPQGHPLTLAEIARDRGVPVSEIISAVEAAVAELQGAGE
jgi:hypothetical protein